MRKHFLVVIAMLVLASLFTACVMPDGQVMTTDGSGAARGGADGSRRLASGARPAHLPHH